MGRQGDPMKRAWGAVVMFIFSFLSYEPLAIEIDAYALNATTTNSIWVLMDTIFPLFWTVFIIMWLAVALFYILKIMS